MTPTSANTTILTTYNSMSQLAGKTIMSIYHLSVNNNAANIFKEWKCKLRIKC